MVETLEHLIRRSVAQPRRARAALYRELLRSETYLLTVDEPPAAEQETRVCRRDDTFPIWADKDAELGGVWVPVFAARDAVGRYVSARELRPPEGQEFLWMGHRSGQVFGLLRGVSCFAGLRLYLDESCAVSLSWTEVQALSEGRLPADAPELYELPVPRLVLPAGLRCAMGRVDAGSGAPEARLFCVPAAGRFEAEDTRKLVRLPLEDGEAWMACRHFVQLLRHLGPAQGGGPEEVLHALIAFRMYGDAEAHCELLLRAGRELHGWLALAAIFALTGRAAECAELCARGAAKYPAESAFALSGARALRTLGRPEQARLLLERALRSNPGERRLADALAECSAAV